VTTKSRAVPLEKQIEVLENVRVGLDHARRNLNRQVEALREINTLPMVAADVHRANDLTLATAAIRISDALAALYEVREAAQREKAL